ncbi:hypothetical protein IFM89_029641 [Coptis chinensis]|uniref:MLO-like protein n=1 Tax=Coptis chinensis TaxID=261450 RepID=A0A835M4S0_9MAGN|nr:hypothetical protein IFM89_029641 [Coptis chinensis]
MAEDAQSLVYTPTWIVAGVCFVIVFISFGAERLLHHIGKLLKRKDQDALFEALQKLKEELMLLGFISLLLTVFQGLISQICIPTLLYAYMLPCKRDDNSSEHEIFMNNAFAPATLWNGRRLLSTGTGPEYCAKKGAVQLLSIEALHQLHIFIFVLAVVHVIFCATTMVLGGLKIREWKKWEESIRHDGSEPGKTPGSVKPAHAHRHLEFFRLRAVGYWRKSVVISWIRAFIKQFHGSVTESDYIAMRLGFIMMHLPSHPDFDFHKYMIRTLEVDFKKVVGISWYLWLFVVIFLLLNVEGWHTYFWLSFLPVILLLLVGAKLEHIISKLAEEVAERKTHDPRTIPMKPSDKHFWFGRPSIILYLIHFILFQNAFEIAFFFWIWSTYGFTSCIMEKVGYIVPRLVLGLIIQVLCSYITLPLYAIVTQMGSNYKKGFLPEPVESTLQRWVEDTKSRMRSGIGSSHHSSSHGVEMQRMAMGTFGRTSTTEGSPVILEGITTLLTESSGAD